MCGISGFLGGPPRPAPEMGRLSTAMADALAHRGPDDAAVWVDDQSALALGFRRLAIIDLSVHGRQPMHSASGRYVITLNGEIYNFPDLRKELADAGATFRGHSDIEVALGIIERDGVMRALEQFNGMFALALWDRRERHLWLARDRFGEKPLYYGWSGRTFLFASELKALRRHPDFTPVIDRRAVTEFFRFSYIPCPLSIYQGIRKLPPGCAVRIAPADAGRDPEPRQFWSAADAARRALENPFRGSEGEAIACLDGTIRRAVGLRMVSDVPLGAFLSGGIDSSTVVACMQALSAKPVRTFTIGFDDATHDESGDARAVAQHLGTEHTELRVRPAEAQAVIPRLPQMYDEPFADSSQIPAAVVSALARRYVTVALSGDAGDELFGGYIRYAWAQRIWRATGWMPGVLRRAGGDLIGRVPPTYWDRSLGPVIERLPAGWRVRSAGEKINKFGAIVGLDTPTRMYDVLVSIWPDPARLVRDAPAGPRPIWFDEPPDAGDLRLAMMYRDVVTYLPDDILAKVDRASMAASLEARVPLLDPAVYELAWRLPVEMKIRGGTGKWILRRVLERYVPAHLFERPKMGFAVPVGAWLRGPLADWASDLLDEGRLRREGWLSPEVVGRIWQAHRSGRADWTYRLWAVLMFEAWLAESGA